MKTLRVRIKDKHAVALDMLAREVNFVWNYCNDLSARHLQRTGKFLTAYDIAPYTAGATKAGLSLHSQTVQAITEEFVTRRKQFKKAKLRWRTSFGSRKSLGWIPFKASGIKYRDGQLHYAGQHFNLWDSYGLSQYAIRIGSFSQDARGRWYANLCVQTAENPTLATSSIGIDLGLKDVAVCSDGSKLEAKQNYRELEAKLGAAQRAGKTKRVKAIHAKIKNRRQDEIHKFTTRLVDSHAAIFVGNVSSLKLAKTRMAKSVLDAGWGLLKTQLKYKAMARSVVFEIVDEANSTQTCSCCGVKPANSPKGRAGLGIREWTCCDCGAQHDRDINVARNILAAGHRRLAVGILVL